jgi:hypothetical protein
MGTGKTESAITMMNEGVDEKYIFITPYLEEVDRIKASCSIRKFYSPEQVGKGKLDDLHTLLGRGCNIASTHALFSTYTPYTAELIHNGGYTLVMDEVYCVVNPIELKKGDYKLLHKSKTIDMAEDGEHVRWINDTYDGRFDDIKEKAASGNLINYKDLLLFWMFPINIFRAFKEVYILTYLFDSQIQKYYFEMHGIDFEKIGVGFTGKQYRFMSKIEIPDRIRNAKKLLHIESDDKLNRIGDYEFALSSSWFTRESKKKGKPLIKTASDNAYNFFHNRHNALVGDVLWTTFLDSKKALTPKGYSRGFLSCNIRAKNEYRSRHCLAYCINVFFHPLFKQYFMDHGATVDEDGYALSEMIQWIWRSAIRDGKDIWVYVPSSRMRGLLTDWVDSLENL